MRGKVIILLLALALLCCLPFSAAALDMQLEVNGKPALSDVPAYSENGRTMVPIRFVMDGLGASVEWNGETQSALVRKNGVELLLRCDSAQVEVNGVPAEMDTPTAVRSERIFVPVRFIAELFNATVNWRAETQTVEIWFAGESGFRLTGYYYDSDSYGSYADYKQYFDTLGHFNYMLTEDGHVSGRQLLRSDRYNEIRQEARRAGQEQLLMVTGFYTYIVDAVVGSEEMRASAISDILSIMQEQGYDGVELDFENMSSSSKENLVTFVRELKAALGDKTLTMSLIPRVSDRETWLAKWDYAALAEICDRINLMFYNQHYSGSSPGPNCGLDWLRQGIEYMLQYIPREKMSVGLGCYGYDWAVTDEGTSGSSVRIATALARAETYGAEIMRDPASGVPYFSYYKLVDKEIEIFDGYYETEEQEIITVDPETGEIHTETQLVTVPVTHTQTVQVYEYHEVWFEDAASMAAKAELARGYRVAGVGLWRMGFIPDDMMLAILQKCL